MGKALRALDLARIIRLVYPTTSLKPPIITDYKKRPRLQFIDTGLLNQILNLQIELLTLKELDDFYRGKIIQHLISQELISIFDNRDYRPQFWVNESKSGGAEVDLVLQHGKFMIPIEIKSGKQGTLKSLHQFVNRADHHYAVRMYSGPFSVESHKTPQGKPYLLMNLPYYLGTRLPDYIKYFINNFR